MKNLISLLIVAFQLVGASALCGSGVDLKSLSVSEGLQINGIVDSSIVPGNIGASMPEYQAIGDVNGDGYSDMAFVAHPYVGGFPPYPVIDYLTDGAVYVVFGNADSSSIETDLSALDGSNGFVVPGDGDTIGYISFEVSGLKDINGDGYDDFAVTTLGFDLNYPPEDWNYIADPQVYVVLGGANFSPTLDLSQLSGSNGFKINVNGMRHTIVSKLGDINGDGLDDVYIAAQERKHNWAKLQQYHELNFSMFYVLYGKSSFSAELNTDDLLVEYESIWDPLDPDVFLEPEDGFLFLGYNNYMNDFGTPSYIGDVNGDGLDDIGIFHHGPHNGPTASVLFGRESFHDYAQTAYWPLPPAPALIHGDFHENIDGDNGFSLLRSGYQHFFNGLSGGDINGDGYNDLLVGISDQGNWPDDLYGEAYVLYGKASGHSSEIELSLLDGTDGFTIQSSSGTHNFGRVVDLEGDFNGDGYADIFVGDNAFESQHYPVVQGTSKGYIIYGRPGVLGTASLDIDSLSSDDLFTITGPDRDLSPNDPALTHPPYPWDPGYVPPAAYTDVVSFVGDMNGDGFDDVQLSSPYKNLLSSPISNDPHIAGMPNMGEYSGAKYVVFGNEAGAVVSEEPLFEESFDSYEEGQNVEWGLDWEGRISGWNFATYENDAIRVHRWMWAKTVDTFVPSEEEAISFSATINTEGAVSVVDSVHLGFGVRVVYDGSEVDVYSNNLGYAPQRYEDTIDVDDTLGSIDVVVTIQGLESRVEILDTSGTSLGVVENTNNRFNFNA